MHALRELGLDGNGLERAGIRILKLGMISPLEPGIAREFARGLDEVLVAEEKGPFVETLLKDALYGMADAPRILGKRDERGEPLLPRELDLDADLIARALAARLEARGVRIDSVEARLRKLAEIHGRRAELPMAQRTPFFCSGCPHNSSVKAPEGTLVGGGIGCHTMVLLNPEGKGEITGITQMGGEGAQWIGMAPFTDDSHLVQNLGDGTFHHSGSLAVRAAVAAGVNITYKLLYNEHVAMTGGQDDRGPAERARPHPLARAGGRAPDHRHHRGHEPLPRGRAGIDRRAARPQGAAQLAAGARGRGGRDRPDPRPGVRGGAAPQAQARQGGGAGGAHLDQRARVRGLRRLRREVELPLGPARGDRVRAQDSDPPGVVQQGPHLPGRRLPLLPDRRPGREGEAPHARARHRAARAAAARGRRGLRRAHDGHRRHRRGHREPDARHGGAARRPARVRPRPDGPLAEGWPRDLGPAHHAPAAGRREQDAGRQRGPLPRLRPARSR